jgi:hypothetical protein
LLLAQASHQLWVEVRLEDSFFAQLDQYQITQPDQHPFRARQGNVRLSTSVFIRCQGDAGCNNFRLKAYGQNTQTNGEFVRQEPKEVDQRWAIHNGWDIGCSFGSSYIWLSAGTDSRQHGMEHYPMWVPGSDTYGTINIKTTYRNRLFKIKVDPLLVHGIKSFNSRLQGSIPETLQDIRSRAAGALRLIHNLASKEDQAVGGFLIEVTVKVKGLREAHQLVINTDFLDPSYWPSSYRLKASHGNVASKGLTAHLVSKELGKDLLPTLIGFAAKLPIQCLLGAVADNPSKERARAKQNTLPSTVFLGGVR